MIFCRRVFIVSISLVVLHFVCPIARVWSVQGVQLAASTQKVYKFVGNLGHRGLDS